MSAVAILLACTTAAALGCTTGPVAAGAPEPAARTLTVAKSGGQYSTIQAASNAAQPGDTILISAGTYNEAVRPKSGSSGAPITYRAVEGENVVVDGDKRLSNGDGLLNLDGRSWLVFDGITVTKSPTHGVYGNEASHLMFTDCEVSSSSNGGLVIIGGSDVVVDRCDVHHNNDKGTSASHEAISMAHGTTRFEVKNSHVHDNGEEGIDAKYESTDGSIHDNVVSDNRGPNIYVDSASRIKIYNNLTYGAKAETKAGIAVAVEDWSESREAIDIEIFNNVSYGNAGGGISFWKESSGTISGIKIINNTIADNPEAGLVGVSEVSGSGNVVRNTIFAGNESGIGGAFAADHNLDDDDPGFVDPSNGDYHLAAGSGAIDAGSASGAPAFDRDNARRPAGAGYDVGAYERAAG